MFSVSKRMFALYSGSSCFLGEADLSVNATHTHSVLSIT